ncbi:hypothetical protein [uncultured Friedmanniella sp.]|uniref:hypothetical protein n=1 Tax=uncultured Friedmanniella sp. TaxID=335381 RepID=UPI0035CBAA92
MKELVEPVTDPVAYYARLAGEMWAFKELAAQQMEELSSWELTLTGPGDSLLGEQARAVIGVYQAAVAQCDRTLGNMVRLGLDAKALQVAQERPSREAAATVLAAVQAAAADPEVGMTPAQVQAFGAAVRKALEAAS